jgi:hypothetical protein
MIWKRPKRIMVLCSICSGEMDMLHVLPGRNDRTKLQVHFCDQCGIKRTVELDATSETRLPA